MGKKEKQIEVETEEKPYNKFQWFLFAIVIPIVFALLLGLIVASVAGINVFQSLKDVGGKVPVISGMMDRDQDAAIDRYKEKVVTLQAEIKNNEVKISKLESMLDTKDKQINKSDLEKERLEQQITELKAVQNDNKKAYKDIIRTYESMAPKKSAPIIASLKEDEAVKLLSNLKPDTLAAILEKMDPAVAARLTQKLTVQNEKTDSGN
ncbi:MotE family protein [Bacillus testis]|uniref:MotE family protein n=1 Tax=Bacillus testis TaxID=1622072 RepID=UPI00067F17C7|nr:MotE family protein [Bacillus testis]